MSYYPRMFWHSVLLLREDAVEGVDEFHHSWIYHFFGKTKWKRGLKTAFSVARDLVLLLLLLLSCTCLWGIENLEFAKGFKRDTITYYSIWKVEGGKKK